MLNTLHITRALENDPSTSPCFAGVFASDQIPATTPFYPCCMVWNTDTSHQPGQHWVCVFISDPHSRIDYFDSYGLPPIVTSFRNFIVKNTRHQRGRNVRFYYNTHTFQGLTTTVCGHYCLYFLRLRCQGYSFNQILHSFPSPVMGESDMYVKECIQAMFSM